MSAYVIVDIAITDPLGYAEYLPGLFVIRLPAQI